MTYPDLPREVHLEILRYVGNDDLHNYRLASKLLAEIGAVELFRILGFHARWDSIRCIKSVGQHHTLRSHVRAVVCNANLWGLSVWDFAGYEDLHLLECGSGCPSMPLRGCPKCGRTRSQLRVEYSQRKGAIHGLEGLVSTHHLWDLLLSLPLLSKLFFTNEALDIQGRRMKKTAPTPDSEHRLLSLGTVSKVHRLILESPGLDAYFLGPSTERYDLQTATHLAGKKLTKLRIDCLDRRTFLPAVYPFGTGTTLPNLRSLKLCLATWYTNFPRSDSDNVLEMRGSPAPYPHGLLKSFLQSLPALKSLSLQLHKRTRHYLHGYITLNDGSSDLGDIFPLGNPWPSLSKLSLDRFDTSEEDLIRLLDSHKGTLETLRMQNMCLKATGSWSRVFEHINKNPTLSRVSLLGNFYIAPAETGKDHIKWNLDERLGRALEHYMNAGGDNPLGLATSVEAN
ncbi:hypothetical protein BCR34DRAFT_580133 [Clohesyomyces aquaticus]|uniref:F-box domain-containing protein n=1 Tax=Clohesyomyces aquaticus TaxID=1231657 RepID=A0A1Y1Y8B3_9PLEO|nr:hypothetical protein BCR34DRAFT_580133 [Clohesyomyces aquaticus]